MNFIKNNLLLIVCAIASIVFCDSALAATSMPWDTGITNIQESLTGPVATGISLIGLIAAGATDHKYVFMGIYSINDDVFLAFCHSPCFYILVKSKDRYSLLSYSKWRIRNAWEDLSSEARAVRCYACLRWWNFRLPQAIDLSRTGNLSYPLR